MSAGCDAPVLISTDEILDAKTVGLWIHGRSLRRAGPFVVLDSRTLDPDVEFDAIARAQGPLPQLGATDSSRGGTLLLLHLEKMPPDAQERLCRFLEHRRSWDPAMFRVIATTDRAFAHVQSARFLGPDVPYSTRFTEIYRRLDTQPAQSRSARFVTALALVSGRRVLFETEAWIDGEIAARPAGEHGFGYDPIFYYALLKKTTAELTLDEKSIVSHRARAFRDLARWLRANNPPAN